jgi:hypothetical protein
MSERDIFNKLKSSYPELIADKYPFPAPYTGDGTIKTIILGADPTHIVHGTPKTLNMVFGLDMEYSPYWNSMKSNLKLLPNLSMEEVYVQNICRNYFTAETSQNKAWQSIAREYWCAFLKNELDAKFDDNVPVLATTSFILDALLIQKNKLKAEDIYNQCISIPSEDNLLSREILAFFRHPKYSLQNWHKYRDFLEGKLKSKQPQ